MQPTVSPSPVIPAPTPWSPRAPVPKNVTAVNAQCLPLQARGSSGRTDPKPSEPSLTSKERGDADLLEGRFDAAISAYTLALQDAVKARQDDVVADRLKDLSRAYSEKGEWNRSFITLNCALALYKRLKKAEEPLYKLMLEIEKRFLQVRCQAGPETFKNLSIDDHADRCQFFNQMRAMEVQHFVSGEKFLKDFSRKIGSFIDAEMIRKMIPILGPLPCAYSLISCQEVFPFSSCRFAILIANEKQKEYFRKMADWFKLMMIGLGETECNFLEMGSFKPIPSGFSVDKNAPLWVGTVKEFAQLQKENDTPATLRGGSLLFGTESLYQDYQKAIAPILAIPSENQKNRAINFLTEQLKALPEPCKQTGDFPIDIERELYQVLRVVLTGLTGYYAIEKTNSWDIIDALVDKGVFDSEATKKVKASFETITDLKIRIQRVVSPAELTKIYTVLIPLRLAVLNACKTGNFAELATIFYPSNYMVEGKANERLGCYEEAKKSYRHALVENPDDAEAKTALAKLNGSQDISPEYGSQVSGVPSTTPPTSPDEEQVPNETETPKSKLDHFKNRTLDVLKSTGQKVQATSAKVQAKIPEPKQFLAGLKSPSNSNTTTNGTQPTADPVSSQNTPPTLATGNAGQVPFSNPPQLVSPIVPAQNVPPSPYTYQPPQVNNPPPPSLTYQSQNVNPSVSPQGIPNANGLDSAPYSSRLRLYLPNLLLK